MPQRIQALQPVIGIVASLGAVALVLLAAVGYRWQIPLSVLWPVPVLVGVATLALHRTVTPLLRTAAASSSPVLGAWGATRLMALMVGLSAVVALGLESGHGRFRVSDNVLANLPARWDAGWYLSIARFGYAWEEGGLSQQQRVAFFPALPLAMRYLADLLTLVARVLGTPDWLGGGNGRYVWAGTLLGLGGSLGGSLYVAAIARRFAGAAAAHRSVWLLMAYPFAVFFSAPYTEGLFLLAVAGAFFHLQFGSSRVAGAFALLAGLTRPNGFLLAPALMATVASTRSARAVPGRWLASTMPLLGVSAYSAFVYSLAGDPLAWMKAQSAWGNTYTLTGFWVAKQAHLSSAGWHFLLEPFGLWSLLAVCLTGIAIVPVGRTLGAGYAAYLVVYLLPPLLINLPAIGRMTCVLFPTFIWLGCWSHTRHRFVAMVIIFLAAQSLCAVHFFTWGRIQ